MWHITGKRIGSAYSVLVGNLRERGRVEEFGANGRIILKWIIME